MPGTKDGAAPSNEAAGDNAWRSEEEEAGVGAPEAEGGAGDRGEDPEDPREAVAGAAAGDLVEVEAARASKLAKPKTSQWGVVSR